MVVHEQCVGRLIHQGAIPHFIQVRLGLGVLGFGDVACSNDSPNDRALFVADRPEAETAYPAITGIAPVQDEFRIRRGFSTQRAWDRPLLGGE